MLAATVEERSFDLRLRVIALLIMLVGVACGGGSRQASRTASPTAPITAGAPTAQVGVPTAGAGQATSVVVTDALPTDSPTVAASPVVDTAPTVTAAVGPAATATVGEPTAATTDTAGPADTAGPVEMRYKYRPGQELVQHVNFGFTITPQQDDGEQEPVKTGVNTTLNLTVKSVARDIATIVAEYTKIGTTLNGRSAGNPNLPRDVLRQLTQTYQVDDLGNIRSVKFASPQAQALQTTPAQGAASPFGPILPERPIAPGDKWTAKQKATNGKNAPQVTSDYTFVGYVQQGGKNLARIRMNFTVPRVQTAQGAEFAGKGTQTFLFDPEAGRMVSMQGNMTGNLVLNVRGNTTRAKAVYNFDSMMEERR